MNNFKVNQKYFYALYLIVAFIFYSYIAYNTPLSGDDWTWGSHTAVEWFHNKFQGYNGRYAGNIFVMLLTRVEWVKVLLKGFFLVLVIWLTVRQSDHINRFTVLLSITLILLIPINIFQQTITWTAGFANYIPATISVLLFSLMIKNIFNEEKPKYHWLLMVFIIPFSIISQLFVENITLYLIVASFVVIVYTIIKHRKIYVIHITAFLSFLIGAVIMFSNSAYHSITSGNDAYSHRTIGTSSENINLISYVFNTYSSYMYKLLFLGNTFLNVTLSILCLIILYKNNNKNKLIRPLLVFILASYPLYNPVVINILRINVLNIYTNQFSSIFALLFWMGVLLTVIFYIDLKPVKLRIIWYMISTIVISAPLIFAHPFGPRNFFTTYILFVVVAIELGNYIMTNLKMKLNVMNSYLTIIGILLMVVYSIAFGEIGSVGADRNIAIKQQIQSKSETITIPKLPYNQFVWRGEPFVQLSNFKNYYHIPKDTKIIIMEYNQWKKRSLHE